jgi:hypothetical protein
MECFLISLTKRIKGKVVHLPQELHKKKIIRHKDYMI